MSYDKSLSGGGWTVGDINPPTQGPTGSPAGLAGYPSGSTPVAAAAAGAATALTPTLAAVASKTTYITSLSISGCGATSGAATGATLTGVLGGTLTIPFAIPTGANVGLQPIVLNFNPPLPASGPNVPIVLNVPSFGVGNLTEAGALQGFQV